VTRKADYRSRRSGRDRLGSRSRSAGPYRGRPAWRRKIASWYRGTAIPSVRDLRSGPDPAGRIRYGWSGTRSCRRQRPRTCQTHHAWSERDPELATFTALGRAPVGWGGRERCRASILGGVLSSDPASWGWNPGTFEALGTVTASMLAAVAVLIAVREQRSQSRARARDQASRISFYETEWRGHPDMSIQLRVGNHSSLPIRGLALVILYNRTNVHDVLLEPRIQAESSLPRYTLRPTGTRVSCIELTPRTRRVLPPGEYGMLDLKIDVRALAGGIRDSIGLVFVDDQERTWVRTLRGQLKSNWKTSLRAR
jgi:hypothetical protein